MIVFGANGLLGRELSPAFARAGWQVAALDRAACDITDHVGVQRAMREARAELVVNLAAYTRVDDAEREATRAFAVNELGAGVVADAARECGARLLHLSTDYVFDGKKQAPYLETDIIAPLGVYARAKAAGEAKVRASGAEAWIVRTGELYGDGGANFFRTVIALARAGRTLRVVDDQWVSPTWTRELALQLVALVEAAPSGTYHATAEGQTTWYDAARAAFEHLQLPATLEPVSTAAYGSPTPRPLFSVLAHEALRARDLYRMRPWRAALQEWLSTRGDE